MKTYIIQSQNTLVKYAVTASDYFQAMEKLVGVRGAGEWRSIDNYTDIECASFFHNDLIDLEKFVMLNMLNEAKQAILNDQELELTTWINNAKLPTLEGDIFMQPIDMLKGLVFEDRGFKFPLYGVMDTVEHMKSGACPELTVLYKAGFLADDPSYARLHPDFIGMILALKDQALYFAAKQRMKHVKHNLK